MNEDPLISCEDEEPNPFCFCPRCDAERKRIHGILTKHGDSIMTTEVDIAEAFTQVAMGELIRREESVFGEIRMPR